METMQPLDVNTEPKKSIFQFAIRWGLLMAMAEIAFSLITYVTNQMQNGYVTWIMYPIIIVIAVLATINFRNKERGGFISFGEAFGVSFQTILYAGIVSSIYTFIFFKFIDPQMIDTILQTAQQKMIDKGTPDDQIEVGMKYVRMFVNPAAMLVMGIIGTLFIGAIFSLVIAAICKKENQVLLPPQ